LNGGLGLDRLIGGADADRFLFDTAQPVDMDEVGT
jgi:Ca2+-binding RTX toxin-like protein